MVDSESDRKMFVSTCSSSEALRWFYRSTDHRHFLTLVAQDRRSSQLVADLVDNRALVNSAAGKSVAVMLFVDELPQSAYRRNGTHAILRPGAWLLDDDPINRGHLTVEPKPIMTINIDLERDLYIQNAIKDSTIGAGSELAQELGLRPSELPALVLASRGIAEPVCIQTRGTCTVDDVIELLNELNELEHHWRDSSAELESVTKSRTGILDLEIVLARARAASEIVRSKWISTATLAGISESGANALAEIAESNAALTPLLGADDLRSQLPPSIDPATLQVLERSPDLRQGLDHLLGVHRLVDRQEDALRKAEAQARRYRHTIARIDMRLAQVGKLHNEVQVLTNRFTNRFGRRLVREKLSRFFGSVARGAGEASKLLSLREQLVKNIT